MTLSSIPSDSFMDFYQHFHNYLEQSLEHGSFIYRGEASATYKLYPGALRRSGIEKLKRLAGKPNSPNCRPAQLEMLAVRHFYRHANTRGLWVPYLEEFGQYNMTEDNLFKKIWNDDIISPKYYELFALAQHYFVPTRFLDWSFDIHVALWFAASSAYKHQKELENKDCEGDKFTLWVMNYEKVKKLKIDYTILSHDQQSQKDTNNSINKKERDTIQFIVPPYASNPNLRAQRGILSYIPINVNTSKIEDGGYFGNSLDESINKSLKENECTDSNATDYIRKFTFSYGEAGKVLRFLSARGYDKASIYPGYQHIAETIELENELRPPLIPHGEY